MNKQENYYKRLHEHPNHIPQCQQTEHIKQRQTIIKKTPYKTTKNNITYTNNIPLIKITRGTCPECQCPTYSYDKWRGEKVCPQCGLVHHENTTTYTPPITIKTKPVQQSLTRQEKQYIKKYGHHKKIYNANKKEWLNNYNNMTVQTLTNQAQLNNKQKNETQYIIDTIGYKKLHPKANKPTIISGVIRYIMKQNYINTNQLRYNQGIFKELLNKETYQIIERNINKHKTTKHTRQNNTNTIKT